MKNKSLFDKICMAIISAFALATASLLCSKLFKFCFANRVIVNKSIALGLAIGLVIGVLFVIIHFWKRIRKIFIYLLAIVTYAFVFFAGDVIFSINELSFNEFAFIFFSVPSSILTTIDIINSLFGKSNCISDYPEVYDVLFATHFIVNITCYVFTTMPTHLQLYFS